VASLKGDEMSPTGLRPEGQLGRMRWGLFTLAVGFGALVGFLVWMALTLDLTFPGM
jgi:hypothetical protein